MKKKALRNRGRLSMALSTFYTTQGHLPRVELPTLDGVLTCQSFVRKMPPQTRPWASLMEVTLQLCFPPRHL